MWQPTIVCKSKYNFLSSFFSFCNWALYSAADLIAFLVNSFSLSLSKGFYLIDKVVRRELFLFS